MTDLWVNYLALKPNADGSYAMTFYETRGNQLATIPTPYQNGFHWEHDWTQVMTWDPESMSTSTARHSSPITTTSASEPKAAR